MELIEGVIGNIETDNSLATARDRHRDTGTLERLVLDGDQRRRSRFRDRTDAGTELGVVVGDEPLAPGDVLLLEQDRMIVVTLADVAALTVTFSDDTSPTTAAAFGHAAGNRHWDLAVGGDAVYVPAGPDPDRRHATLRSKLPDTATIQMTTVSPNLFAERATAAGDPHTDPNHSHDANHGRGASHTREMSDHGRSDVETTVGYDGDRP